MIDNYTNIKSHLCFEGGVFYYLQVLQRKKDNPELSWMTREIYSRFIKSSEDFDNTYEVSKKIADLYNARVYIDLSPGSFEKLTFLTLKELSTRIYNKSYQDIFKLFDKLAPLDEVKIKDGKKWMIDVDYKKGTKEHYNIINYLIKHISITGEVGTLGGVHLITKPFNYKLEFKDLEVIDNDRNYKLPTGETFGLKLGCNTLLYYGDVKSL